MNCDHRTLEEFAHCEKLTAFERIARDAKGLLEARQKLMNLMGTGQAWDDQQAVVQSCVASLEASIRSADVLGLLFNSNG